MAHKKAQRKVIDGLLRHVAELEQRIAALEARPVITYFPTQSPAPFISPSTPFFPFQPSRTSEPLPPWPTIICGGGDTVNAH